MNDEHITLGVTSDYAWYELTQVQNQLKAMSNQIEHLIAVIRAREDDQAQYVSHLKAQCSTLQARLNALRSED
jgi:hypothetical protein